MAIGVEIQPDSELTPTERALFASWDKQYFGGQELLAGYSWAPAGWRVIVRDAGVPVSHLDITLREALHGTQPVRAGGIGTVMTPAALRGRGYAQLALAQAQAFLFEKLVVDLGLLICLPALCPFYTRLGWLTLESPLVFEQAGRQVVWPHAAMVLPRIPGNWHDGPIDLCGLPW